MLFIILNSLKSGHRKMVIEARHGSWYQNRSRWNISISVGQLLTLYANSTHHAVDILNQHCFSIIERLICNIYSQEYIQLHSSSIQRFLWMPQEAYISICYRLKNKSFYWICTTKRKLIASWYFIPRVKESKKYLQEPHYNLCSHHLSNHQQEGSQQHLQDDYKFCFLASIAKSRDGSISIINNTSC